jgi:hypothetical protein
MIPKLLPDGRIELPIRAEGEEDGLIGDATEIIGPDDPRYAEIFAALKELEKPGGTEE